MEHNQDHSGKTIVEHDGVIEEMSKAAEEVSKDKPSTNNGRYISTLFGAGLTTPAGNGVESVLKIAGMVKPSEVIALKTYNPDAGVEQNFGVDMAMTILKQARKGVANLVTTLGVDSSAFNKGIQSRMFSVINSMSQFRYSDAYARWILTEIDASEGYRGITARDRKDRKNNLENESDVTTASSSLIMLIAAQSLVAKDANSGEFFSYKELEALQRNTELKDLATKANKTLLEVSLDIVDALVGSGAVAPFTPFDFGSDFDAMLEIVSKIDPTIKDRLVDAFDNLTSLLTAVTEATPSLTDNGNTDVVSQTAFYMLRAELVKSIQMRITVDLNSIGSVISEGGKETVKNMNKGIAAISLKALNDRAGESVVSLIDDMMHFSYTYKAVVDSINNINKVNYSASQTSSLLNNYANKLGSLRDISSEDDALRTLTRLTDDSSWTNSLAAIFYNLAYVSINDGELMTSSEYSKLLSMMDNVLTKNELFGIKHDAHTSLLALGSSNIDTVTFGTVFSIEQQSITYSDIFDMSRQDEKISSIVELTDKVRLNLMDPTKSPLFRTIYKLLVMRGVMSDTVRVKVAVGAAAKIMDPFNFNEGSEKKVQPKATMISNAIMAEMGTYYLASAIVQQISLHALKHQMALFFELHNEKEHQNSYLFIESQEVLKHAKEMDETISNALSDIQKVLGNADASCIVDSDKISFSDDLIMKEATSNNNSIDEAVINLFTKDKVRAAKGIIYNASKQYISLKVSGVTIHSTTDLDNLDETLKRDAMMLVAQPPYNESIVQKKDGSIDAMIDSIRHELGRNITSDVQEHAMGKMLSINFDLRRVVEQNERSDRADMVNDDYKMVEAMKEIIDVRKRRHFVLPGDNSRIERRAYQTIKPMLFHTMLVFKPAWKKLSKAFHTSTLVSIPFYDTEHATLKILEKIGLDPNMTVTSAERSFLSSMLGAGSVFDVLPAAEFAKAGMRLMDVLTLDVELAESGRMTRMLNVCVLPHESVYDLFNDSVVISNKIAESRLLTVNKLAGTTDVVSRTDNMGITLLSTSIERDLVHRQFVTKDSLLRRIFDEVLIPLTEQLWK